MASRSFTIQTGIGPRGPQGPPGDGGGGSWDTITGGAANYVPMDITPTSIPTTEGTLSWNTDDHTLNIQTDIVGTVIQVGTESVIRVRNATGSTITNGSVVYINGSSGQRPTIALADADDSTHAASTIGLATSDITNNSFGFVTILGLVRSVNTNGIAEGTPLYLSSTAGAFTATAPTTNRIRIGWVAVEGVNGTVLVSVTKQSVSSADVLDAVSTATSNVIAKRGSSGECAFTSITVGGGSFTASYGNSAPLTANRSHYTPDATGTIALTGDSTGIPDAMKIGIITESTTARTLSGTDIHKKIRYTNASGCAITIPNGIGVAGTVIIGRRATGAGALSFTLGGSVTVNNSGIASIAAGQEFALMALSANEYDFI